MAGVFAVMLGGDAVIRLVQPEFLLAGVLGTLVLWGALLAPIAAVAALSAVTMAVAVAAARARLSADAADATRATPR